MATTSITSPPKERNQISKMVAEAYKETKKSGKSVKSKLIGVVDPIRQTNDKYLPVHRRQYTLTESYNQKMSEKKEKPRKTRIPQKNTILAGLKPNPTVVEKPHLKTWAKNLKNTESTKTYENDKHIKTYPQKDDLEPVFHHNPQKNGYQKIIVSRKRYIPANNTTDILNMKPRKTDEYFTNSIRGHYRHNSETTYERIFTVGNKEDYIEKKNKNLYKPQKFYKITSDSVGDLFKTKQNEKQLEENIAIKPNNYSFRSLSDQARINLNEKYYYDNNESQI